MNRIRGVVSLSLRGYRTNRGRESARRVKAPRQIEMIQPGMPVESIFEEGNDPEDLDEFASDFQNVAQFDKMHERETEIEKAKRMTQIVKRKYFKSEEPAMLTWAEKEQIRRLHAQDPEEWTPEALSDSFPVSRDAVLRILRSKWSVKSVKVVEKYERNVKKNWDLFKAGKLQVDPKLEAHLAKFKDRKIKPMDPETIAKTIITPEPVFPKPQSKLFSDIIQSYLDVNPSSRDEEEDDFPAKNDVSSRKKLEAPKKKSLEEILQRKETSGEPRGSKKLEIARNSHRKTPFTFDHFLRTHAESVREEEMTPVDRVIVDEVKQRTTEEYKSKSLVFESASPVAAWKKRDETTERLAATFHEVVSVSGSEKSAELRQAPEEARQESGVSRIQSRNSSQPEVANNLEGSLETGIVARHKTEAAREDDYPEFIKIPRKKYKRGVTYKVADRYYDDDGELLYRVPGLKS